MQLTKSIDNTLDNAMSNSKKKKKNQIDSLLKISQSINVAWRTHKRNGKIYFLKLLLIDFGQH